MRGGGVRPAERGLIAERPRSFHRLAIRAQGNRPNRIDSGAGKEIHSANCFLPVRATSRREQLRLAQNKFRNKTSKGVRL
jgi:hypothetical protein